MHMLVLQLNENASKYKESLLRFVKDLGPTAQRVAAKKLEVISPVENVSYFHESAVQEHTNRLHLGANRTSNTRQWNTSAGTPTMLATGSSSNVFAHVHPTSMFSGRPQPRLTGNRNSLSLFSSLIPNPCLVSHSRPENSMSCMPSNNLALLPLVHQPRSEGTSNLSDLPLVSQPTPRESMYAMPSNNLTKLSLFPHREDCVSRMNPHGPVPQQEPNSSFLQILLGGETNNYGEGGGTLIGKLEAVPPQLPLNNDNDDHEEPNLELHL